MKNLEDKYREFYRLPFPDMLEEGDLWFDLVSLDSSIAGIIDKYFERKGHLNMSDVDLLKMLTSDLKTMTEKLKGIEQDYFLILLDLSNQVILKLY